MGTYNNSKCKFITKEMLEEYYVRQELPFVKVGEKLGVSGTSVWRALIKYNILRRDRGWGKEPWNKNRIHKICKECNKKFTVSPYRKDTAKYCSYYCRDKSKRFDKEKFYHICELCGKKYYNRNHRTMSRFCGRECSLIHSIKTKKIKYTRPDVYTCLEKIIKDKLMQNNINFKHNKRFGKYVVDFFIPESRYIIEVDGYSHKFDKEGKREIRDKYLEEGNCIIEHIIMEDVNNWEPTFQKQI